MGGCQVHTIPGYHAVLLVKRKCISQPNHHQDAVMDRSNRNFLFQRLVTSFKELVALDYPLHFLHASSDLQKMMPKLRFEPCRQVLLSQEFLDREFDDSVDPEEHLVEIISGERIVLTLSLCNISSASTCIPPILN